MPADFFFPFNLPPGVRLAVLAHDSGAGRGLSLSEIEDARIARLKRTEQHGDLRRSFQARRHAIAGITGAACGEVELAWTEDGAPMLREPAGWSLSVSAVEGVTALALAPAGTPLGVDISVVREIGWRPMLQMVSAAGEAAEFVDAFGGEAAQVLPAFHRLWVIKEAVLKATCRGMRAGAKNVPVTMDWLAAPSAAFALTAFDRRFSGVVGGADGVAISVVAGARQR